MVWNTLFKAALTLLILVNYSSRMPPKRKREGKETKAVKNSEKISIEDNEETAKEK